MGLQCSSTASSANLTAYIRKLEQDAGALGFDYASVWSLAYRRDNPPGIPEVGALQGALAGGDRVVTTGVILLGLLRGFVPDRARQTIRGDFGSLDIVEPRWSDYEGTAELSDACRRGGVQLGSIDALIARLAIAHELALLTTDQDFVHAARHIPVRIWGA